MVDCGIPVGADKGLKFVECLSLKTFPLKGNFPDWGFSSSLDNYFVKNVNYLDNCFEVPGSKAPTVNY